MITNSKKIPRWLCVLMFFLPWLPKILFGLPWLMLQNFTDGVFYLAYALHFRDLIDGSPQKLRIRNFSPHGVRSRVKIEDLSLVDVLPSKS